MEIENKSKSKGNPAWCKGVSGNPGGRPKVVADVQALARIHTKDAIKTLVAMMLEAENEGTRVAAARELLDRGYGKSSQSIQHTGDVGSPLEFLVRISPSDIP